MKIRDRLDPLIEIRQVEFFIWRMEIVAIQPESHKDDLDPQLLFKQRTDRDAAAAADGDGRLPESGLDRLSRRLIGLAVDRRHIGLTAVMLLRFYRHAFRGDL